MRCVRCRRDTEVIRTEHVSDFRDRRQRQCCSCGARFTTFETVSSDDEGLVDAPAKQETQSARRPRRRVISQASAFFRVG